MIRTLNEQELRRIGGMLWATRNSCSWEVDDQKDLIPRAYCSAIVAQISYCLITDDEIERRNRAKVVPSFWHHELILGEQLNVVEILGQSDIPVVEIFRSKYFLIVLLRLSTTTFIGIRGTQFAYDWLKNINLLRIKDSNFKTASRFHRGFYREAVLLEKKIIEYLGKNGGLKSIDPICLCGHSLGGAIASILFQSDFLQRPQFDPICPTEFPNFCYVFGSPRITNRLGQNIINQPIAVRTALDIVPNCPPRMGGYYSDFRNQIDTSGKQFSGRKGESLFAFPNWLRKLLVYEGVKSHLIEVYRQEIREVIRHSHPRIDGYLTEIESRHY